MSDNFMRIRKGLIVTPTTSIPTSSVDGAILFDDNEKKFKRWDSNANAWVPLGEGAGELNFLELSNKAHDAESGITGWSTYKNAAQARPVDGTGGTATVVSAISTTSTNPLSGTKSFLFAKGSGNAQGEGWSVDFQIDRARQASVVQIEFDYRLDSGTFVAGSSVDYTTAGDSDLIVYIYDVDNGVTIEPTTFRLYSNSTGITDRFVGNFQTSHNGVNYRLIFHVATTSTAAWTLKVDNIKVKPAKYTYGTPITDWQEYTPTFNSGFTVGTGGYAYNKWYWRRVGGDCEIKGSFKLGASGFNMGSGNFTFTLPSGLSLDEGRLNGAGLGNNGSNWARVGVVALYDNGGGGNSSSYFVARNILSLNSFVVIGKTNSGIDFALNSTNPFTWGSDDELYVYAMSVPIAGWSSSVKVAEPMERRDVVLHLERSTFFTFNHGTLTTIPFSISDVKLDTASTFDDANDAFLCPTSGYYLISGNAKFVGSNPNHKSLYARILNQNLTIKHSFVLCGQYNATMDSTFPISYIVYLNAGERLIFLGHGGGGGTSSVLPSIQITRLPSSQVLADYETVVVRANNMSGPTLIAESSNNIGNWTKQVDTHNSFNATSGVFTAPQPGHYLVCIQAVLNNVNTNGIFKWFASELSSEGLGNGAHTTCNGGTFTPVGFNGSFVITAYKAGAQFQIGAGIFGTGGNRTIRNVYNTDCTLSITKIK